jgi:DNA-directed RNA polymerase specialized sigma24 family protein
MTVTVCRDNADAAFRSLYSEHGPALLRHLAVDAYRARQSRPAEAELTDHLALAGGQQPDASLDEVSVRAAIAALPGPQRQVLTEIYYRDRSVAETARILRIPPGTVRSRTFYGLPALRRVLAAHDALSCGGTRYGRWS